jgi:hypothetical protein
MLNEQDFQKTDELGAKIKKLKKNNYILVELRKL